MNTIERLSDAAERERAVDPTRSVIVQAPAGSGKTSLLVERYLRLLARVSQPEEVLAITFTRKAASEMRRRVMHALNDATHAAREVLARSHALEWDIERQPERMKIQTIDSFAFTLINRLPFSSRFGLDYEFLEDCSWLYREAAARLIERMMTNDPLGDEIARFLSLVDNDYATAVALLSQMLERRDQWLDPVSAIARTQTTGSSGFAEVIESAIDSLNQKVTAEIQASMPSDLLLESKALCAFAARNLDKRFDDFETLEDWCFLGALTTTDKGTPRKQINKNVGFPTLARAEKQRCAELIEALGNLDLIPRMAILRHLPPPRVSQAEHDALASFSVTLSLAALELASVFREHEHVDFTELTFAARRALERDGMPTDLALALDYKISHVLIDEFQDTSLAQYRLLTRLLEGWQPDDGNTFFAVGDPMQSIYRFRDADLGLYQKTYASGLPQKNLQPVRLTSNFRSARALVDWTNTVFSQLFAGHEDALLGAVAYAPAAPVRDHAGIIETTVCRDDPRAENQALLVANTVRRLREASPDESIAVLVRTRNALPPLLKAFRRAGIKWHGVDIEPLGEVPVVRDLYALLRALFDPRDRLAWLSVLRSPLFGIPLSELEVLARHDDRDAMLSETALSDDTRARLDRLRALLPSLPSRGSIRTRLEKAWIRLGGADAYPGAEDIPNADRFFELLEAQSPTSGFLERLWSALQTLYASELSDTADLEIMTIHRAKGLEFDHVVLPGLERSAQSNSRPLLLWRPEGDGLLMGCRDVAGGSSVYSWLRREEAAKDDNELKRLLYVAVTRAGRSLSLFASHDGGAAPQGSFLAMLESMISIEDYVDPTGTVTQESLFSTNYWTRLERDYVWRPPTRLPTIATHAVEDRVPEGTRLDPVGARREIALGLLVHRELKTLAERAHPEAPSPQRIAAWRATLTAEGFDDADRDWVTEQAQRQIASVLTDTDGRWLFDPTHDDAGSERSYTGHLGNQIVNVVVDRTFVDAAGVRWIVDYKSTAPITPTPAFISEQVAQYSAQLRRYAAVVAATEDRRIRLALYLTSIPRLIEIEASGQSATEERTSKSPRLDRY